jgi:hypothetical protein
MDIRVVWRNHYSPEFGLVEHKLECQSEISFHIHICQDRPRSQVNQGSPNC